MKTAHILAIAFIFICTTFAWWFLGGTIHYRTDHVARQTSDSVSGRWGPSLVQQHPAARYTATSGTAVALQPASSAVQVAIDYQPVKMGLLWHRTYGVKFAGAYTFTNSTNITHTFAIDFKLPKTTLDKVRFTVGAEGKAEHSVAAPEDGIITHNVQLGPNESIPVNVSYECRGMDSWEYAFADATRIRQFALAMTTNFDEVNFPISSPKSRKTTDGGMQLTWHYEDAISAPGVAIDMPQEVNAGPVAARISLFAPLSLAMFFGVMLITTVSRGIPLHPVNYFFMAAGFFAFPLLFSYMVDIVQVHLSFVLAAATSVALVCGYLRAAAGEFVFRVGLLAQTAYLVLFSYSFFFKGFTGLTLTVGGVATLAALMAMTAKMDWSRQLGALSPRLA